jgi:hypothetical protein
MARSPSKNGGKSSANGAAFKHITTLIWIACDFTLIYLFYYITLLMVESFPPTRWEKVSSMEDLATILLLIQSYQQREYLF